MLAFTLSSLKDATSHLFTQPSFDDFDVLSVTIVSYITFSMDGHLNAAFFEDADTQPDKLCSWQRLRPVCFSIIKGFSLDRDSERLWDHYVAAWIKQKQLDFEEA